MAGPANAWLLDAKPSNVDRKTSMNKTLSTLVLAAFAAVAFNGQAASHAAAAPAKKAEAPAKAASAAAPAASAAPAKKDAAKK